MRYNQIFKSILFSVGLSLAQAPNTLTTLEQAQGFELLFTGTIQSVRDNWVTYQKDGPNVTTLPANIQVGPNGEYFVDQGATQDIRSKKTWSDFEFRFDYRISDNAGLFYRLALLTSAPYENSIEYPIYDGTPAGAIEWNGAGAAYDIYQPSVNNYKKFTTNEWNSGIIRLIKDSVYHWHNGVMVVKFSLSSADFRQRLDARKWATVPCVAMEAATAAQCSHSNPYRASGYLGFQTGYPGNLYLRNLKVAKYPFTTSNLNSTLSGNAAISLNHVDRSGFSINAAQGQAYTVELSNAQGKILKAITGKGPQWIALPQALPTGLYFARFKTLSIISVQKIVIH